MFVLFVNLYLALFTGTWENMNFQTLCARLIEPLNGIGQFLTSIFGDSTYTSLGNAILNPNQNGAYYQNMSFPLIVATILGLITSIGIVVMAVKGVKKAFGIFFGQIR